MSEKSSNDSGTPSAKTMFTFRQSALAAKADQLWNQSKSGSGFGITPSMHVQLEKKSLDDVLGRMAAEKRQRQEREEKGRQQFVFGSKISDRVLKESSTTSENGSSNGEEDKEACKPKTAEELFRTAARHDKQREDFDFLAEAKEEPEKKKEHERPSTSIITVTTGEENDVSIFQTACKLHSFDTDKNAWVERGLAHIKINRQDEDGDVHHRIVARTTGNQRVVINSKVHADMLFERVDAKRLKISATTPDSNAMQIFLVTIGFSKTALNTDEFCATLESVLELERAKQPTKRKRKTSEEGSVSPKISRKSTQDDHVLSDEHSEVGSGDGETNEVEKAN